MRIESRRSAIRCLRTNLPSELIEAVLAFADDTWANKRALNRHFEAFLEYNFRSEPGEAMLNTLCGRNEYFPCICSHWNNHRIIQPLVILPYNFHTLDGLPPNLARFKHPIVFKYIAMGAREGRLYL